MSMANLSRVRCFVLLLIALIAVAATFSTPYQASAHPLGNFTVNQYTRIEFANESLRLVYVLDMAEIPAFQERQRIDTNGNGTVDEAETDAYLDEQVPEIVGQLNLEVDGDIIKLVPESKELTFPEGQAGLSVLRLELVLAPSHNALLSTSSKAITLQNNYATDRLGWREIIVTHGEDIFLSGIAVPETDSSNELRNYREDLLKSPLDEREVEFEASLQPGPAAPGYDAFVSANGADGSSGDRPEGGETGMRFAALLDSQKATTTGLIISLLAAMLWGAAHALSPGHGKTIVGAYLVGSRGTPRHAALLGLTVTITHTAGVIALGLVTLFASNYILPERIFPWISVISGLTVVAVGLWTLRTRLRGGTDHHHHEHAHDHHHDHDHKDPHSHGGHTHSHLPRSDLGDGERLSLRSLIALGISGGLLPCPSALVVLLGSIALGRIGFGLALVASFSLGLAMTLTLVGLAFLYAGRVLNSRLTGRRRLTYILRIAPVVGSLALTLAGALIILRALGETSLR
jgi:nickel/cobalt exporter